MPADLPWLNGWPRMGLSGVLIGSGVHCVGCGDLHGVTCVVIDLDWTPPAERPAYPFRPGDCPVCAAPGAPSPVQDVRISDVQRGQHWLLEGSWVRVVRTVVGHPDDRVAITYELDDEQFTNRQYRGFERAAVR